MKKTLVILIVLFIVPLGLLLYRSWSVEKSNFNKVNFLTGIFPSPQPDGFYKGSIQALDTPWEGKIFDASHSVGINKIKGKEVFPFKTYKAKSLSANMEVLKLDYNLPQNPFWVKIVSDEIAQDIENNLIGKVYLKLIPEFPISLGFFKLER